MSSINYKIKPNSKINLINQIDTFKYNNTLESNIFDENSVSLTTNLFKINFIDNINSIIIFSINLNPASIQDNLLFKKKFYEEIEKNLNKYFINIFFSGNELYVMDKFIINENIDIQNFEYSFYINVLNTNYYIIILYKNIIYFNSENEYNNFQLKKYLEKFFRYILFNNKNIKKFIDDTIINIKDIKKLDKKNRIYKCFLTSIQITNNGFYMKINSFNKIISNSTALDKINELKGTNMGKIDESKLKQIIEDYFIQNPTVYDIFEKYKKYRIKCINFTKNPTNTNINILDDDNKLKTINLYHFYKIKYGIEIQYINQPLIEVFTNFINNNELSNNKTFYLIPELVYINSFDKENDKNLQKNIKYESTITPKKKLEHIFSLAEEYNKNENIKKLMEKFGIKIGNNLNVNGRMISQPTLIFSNKLNIKAINGLYDSSAPLQIFTINNNDLFYICDKNNKISVGTIFSNLINRMKYFGFNFTDDFNYNKINRYYIRTDTWDEALNDLYNIKNYRYKFGFVFVNESLYKYYGKLKKFFYENNIITQFCTLNKINENKNLKLNSIIEQVYIKIGGQINYIDFYKESIIEKDKLYLIIGLKSEICEKNKIKYCFVSTKNKYLNVINTSIKVCNNDKQEKFNALTNLFEEAINKFIEYNGKEPNSIILYRKGGNLLKNIYILKEEKSIFVKLIKSIENNYKSSISFYYICCNLSCNMKLFEINNINNNISFSNPRSGLIVDSNVNSKNKFEFYIQNQTVLEGTATPSFYQILFIYNGDKDVQKLKIIEKLTFYLSYSYSNFKGSIREPGPLKMTEKAIDFFSNCFKNNSIYNEYHFETPIYI